MNNYDNSMGYPLAVTLNKKSLYDRLCFDLMQQCRAVTPAIELCEYDRQWFQVAIDTALSDVMTASQCIVDKGIPYLNTIDEVELYYRCANEQQEALLPEAVQRYMIADLLFLWLRNSEYAKFAEAPTAQYDNLRHVVLLNNGVSRKNRF